MPKPLTVSVTDDNYAILERARKYAVKMEKQRSRNGERGRPVSLSQLIFIALDSYMQ